MVDRTGAESRISGEDGQLRSGTAARLGSGAECAGSCPEPTALTVVLPCEGLIDSSGVPAGRRACPVAFGDCGAFRWALWGSALFPWSFLSQTLASTSDWFLAKASENSLAAAFDSPLLSIKYPKL